MMNKNKRHFFKRSVLREIAEVTAGFQAGLQQAEEQADFDDFFKSYESSYALTLAYPDEILLETARQMGIETDGREINDIVKELFEKKGGYGHRS